MREALYESRAAASTAAARRIGTLLQRELAKSARASLVASGGNTPKACYQILARTDLAWDRVDVLPSDERQVAAGHELHNGTMIAQNLARATALHPLDDFDTLAKPITVTLLGVGEDGHFASIFSDMNDFRTAVDLQSTVSTMRVVTQASPVPRTTLTLSALCASRHIVLLAFGKAKRAALTNPDGLPVQHLLAQDRVPVELIWSP